ncbi:winged helix-turn-helix transcriptional regulator [Microbispora sp. NEAU-D428]|uniref:ArsR/SmtB family transcription factor n=1 Tax=Microbispora sitophila TaxID=2771537 RepID=UPI001867F0F8|nr:winged helix-turn-helix domain-containing protein [Microbispora sitophila]MBE3009416.1 winged helix-turn-helix transcriptional regulator [Microbispora sitophila]
MLRLEFTDADLRQITVAATPDVVLETALSVRRLRTGAGGGSRSLPGLRRLHHLVNGSLAARAGVLLEVVPPEGFLPDFLLQPAARDLAAGVELIAQVPEAQFAADLSALPPSPAPSRWFRELASGAVAARRTLADDLRTYFRSSLAPVWQTVQAAAAADRSLRAETLLRGGIDALLATLNTRWHWQPPVLHIPSHLSYDVPLCGRGLLLIPSYFAPTPLLTWRPGLSTVLVYPICRDDDRAGSADALGPLLGRTRAAVLAALRDPATTTALAERAGVSLASASQHATVLRNAGLVSTTRIGGAVLHALTPLGAALLRGDAVAG